MVYSLNSFGMRLVFSLMIATATMNAARADDVRIAAVVNDEIISIGDVNSRVDLLLASSNLPNDPTTRKKVTAQVVRQLIDEKLQLQEAKKQTIKISPDELKKALRSLEENNNLPVGGLKKFLDQKGIEITTLEQQLQAQFTWARTVRSRYMRTVAVGEEEVTEALREAEANSSLPSNRLFEIYLSVNEPSQENDVKDFAERLTQEISSGGGPQLFQRVARQFSQSATAAVGGDIGYVRPGTLDPEAEKIITLMSPGQLTKPLRLTGGYYIYLLADRKIPDSINNVKVTLSQIVYPLAKTASDAEKQDVIARIEKATADLRSCGELEKLGQEQSPDLSGPVGEVLIKDLPPELSPLIQAAAVAQPTKAVPVNSGIGVFMVCSRTGGPEKISRDDVEDTLVRNRLENLARRYLSDLRRTAYIDQRI